METAPALDARLAAARAESRDGNYQVALTLLQAGLAACPPGEPARRAALLAEQANAYSRLGRQQDSLRSASEATVLAEPLDRPALLADALTTLSMAYAQLLMGRDALDCGLRALSAARTAGDAWRESWALTRVGLAYAALDNPVQTCEITRQALEIAQTLDDDELRLTALNNLAYFRLLSCGDSQLLDDTAALTLARQEALDLSTEAVTLARASPNPYHMAAALSNRVEALLGSGDAKGSQPMLDEFEALARKHGYLALEAQAALQRAQIDRALGRLPAALSRLIELASDERQLPPRQQRLLIRALYETYKAAGDPAQALHYLERHVALDRQTARDTMSLQTQAKLIRQEVEQAQARAEHALRDADCQRERAQRAEAEQLRLRELAMALDRAAHEDVLTSLHNRRHAELALPLLLDSARSSGRPLWLAMLDIDHFKVINDDYGHGVGDRTLQRLAQLLRQRVRGADLLARVGGEEFTIVFLGMPAQTALEVCERLREAVATHDWDEIAVGLAVSISIGMAEAQEGEDARTLQERADRALYAAKRGGRNRVCRA